MVTSQPLPKEMDVLAGMLRCPSRTMPAGTGVGSHLGTEGVMPAGPFTSSQALLGTAAAGKVCPGGIRNTPKHSHTQRMASPLHPSTRSEVALAGNCYRMRLVHMEAERNQPGRNGPTRQQSVPGQIHASIRALAVGRSLRGSNSLPCAQRGAQTGIQGTAAPNPAPQTWYEQMTPEPSSCLLP